MAKSGFWMRGAKGKLAGTAFYQSNGATIQREIVTPKNRKTNGQMTQRAKFANCIKFFKHSQQALFKFAFEDKRKQESDYNAFVRMNIKRSAVYDKELVDNPIYPAIGHNWVLASGSLTPARVGFDGLVPYIALPSAANLTHTLGVLSQAFIKDYDLQAGDIVTMVTVVSDIRYADQQPETYPKWTILQWQIDPNSEDSIINGRVFKQAVVNNGKFRPSTNGALETAAGFACIFSRNIEGGKLRASYAELVNNEFAQNFVDNAESSESVIKRALASWGATGDVILQGSQVVNKTLAPYVEPVVTSINGEEDVPLMATVINAGDDAEYELEISKSGYVLQDEDIICDNPNVIVTVVGDTSIRVTASASASSGDQFNIKFHGQLIINGYIAAEVGEDITVIKTHFDLSGNSFENIIEGEDADVVFGALQLASDAQILSSIPLKQVVIEGEKAFVSDDFHVDDEGTPIARVTVGFNALAGVISAGTDAAVSVTLYGLILDGVLHKFVTA